MNKEVRSTIYLEEDLYKRFREACNKKFGDKQGKIKQGYVLAISNFANEVLGQELVDIVIETKPEQVSAKELVEKTIPEQVSAKEIVEETIPDQPDQVSEPDQVSAKKLVEAEIKTPQQVIEESKIPQEPMEQPTTVADNPPVSATIPEEAKTVSADVGLSGLIGSLQNKEATASVQLDQDSELHTITEPLLKTPEELEEQRLAKVKEDQRISRIESQSTFVAENSPEAKAKRLLERERAVKNQ